MIYPPINELVEKTGNRYSLVIITAKRARELAQDERNRDKDNPKSSDQNDSSMKQRMYERSKQPKPVKPIIRALDEIISGDIRISRSDEHTLRKVVEQNA